MARMWYENATEYGENRETFLSYDIQVMDLRRAYEDVLDSGDQALIDRVKAAVDRYDAVDAVLRIIDLSGAVLACVLFGLCLARLVELHSQHKRKPTGRRRSNFSWVVTSLLAAYNLCVILMLVADNLVLYGGLTRQQANLAWKLNVLWYLMGNYFLYIVLFKRAETVLNTPMFVGNPRVQKVKRLVKMMLASFVIFLPLPFFTIYGIYFPPERSIITINPLAAWIFLACDTTFSLMLLSLFLWPVVQVVRAGHGSGENGSDNSILRVAKKNFALSLVAISSTFIAMTMAGLLTTLCGGLPTISNLGDQYNRPLVQILTSVDIKINQVCVHALTTVWIPHWLRSRLESRECSSGIDSSERSGGKTNDDNTMTSPSGVPAYANLSFYAAEAAK
jgi:hypothetical protein